MGEQQKTQVSVGDAIEQGSMYIQQCAKQIMGVELGEKASQEEWAKYNVSKDDLTILSGIDKETFAKLLVNFSRSNIDLGAGEEALVEKYKAASQELLNEPQQAAFDRAIPGVVKASKELQSCTSEKINAWLETHEVTSPDNTPALDGRGDGISSDQSPKGRTP